MENLFLLSLSLNSDIFETNIINIVLLVAILFNVIGTFLKEQLLERKTKILEEVQGAEQRLNEAVERLAEAKLQASQAKLVITQITEKTETLRNKILLSNWNRTFEEMQRLEKSAALAIKYETQKVASENQDSLLTKGLKNAYFFISNDLSYEACCELNTRRIEKIPQVS